MSSTAHTTDVVIIGAGPVGLFAIFECGMFRLKCHVIDALDMVGGQCMALYPEKPIYDIPAHPEITGAELIEHLARQAQPFEPVFHLSQRVERVERADKGRWQIETSQVTVINASAIIIAAGVGAFGPNRPPLENIESYEGTSIFYYVKNRETFRGKRLVIAGGGDSAIDWALSLYPLAERISLVHRRSKFRAAPESLAKIHELAEAGKIDLVVPYQLAGLEGSDGTLNHVVVESLEGEKRHVPADILLPFYGLAMKLGPIAEWGLNLHVNHIVVDPATGSTNTAGIYAIGDVATYPHKLKLILTGFAEAAQAAHAIRQQLHPDEVFHFEHSTTQGIPKIA